LRVRGEYIVRGLRNADLRKHLPRTALGEINPDHVEAE
jgi:hypothetical protein